MAPFHVRAARRARSLLTSWARSCVVLAVTACGSLAGEAPKPEVMLNYCERSQDCREGRCDLDLHACVAESPELELLLIEVIPRSSDLGFGAYNFLYWISDVSDPDQWQLSVESPPTLRGTLGLFFPNPAVDGKSCLSRHVRLTLTPRERALGLGVQSYTTTTITATNPLANEEREFFNMAIPPGDYDLHWVEADPEPEDAVWSNPACRQIVPQLARGVKVPPAAQQVVTRLDLLQTTMDAVRPLEVRVPWDISEGSTDPGLEGWLVDVVHPVTGERLSTVERLTRGDVVADERGNWVALARLELSAPQEYVEDYAAAGNELLRLRPPAQDWVPKSPDAAPLRSCVRHNSCPTRLKSLLTAEAFERGVALAEAVPAVSTVDFQGWVWDAESGQPVAGQITIQTPDLQESQFRRTYSIGEHGEVQARLPTGTYDVRIFPYASGDLGAVQTELTIWPPAAGRSAEELPVQAGQVFYVPRGGEVQGEVRLPTLASADGFVAHLTATIRGGLSRVLNNEPFMTRSATALLEGSRFHVRGVDCRGCTEQLPASLDLRIVPSAGSGLPWIVRPNISVGASRVELGTLAMSPPHRVTGTLTAGGDVGFPGPMIRAYALLNDLGEVVSDRTLVVCAELLHRSPEQRCVQRVVQVGETRAGEQGAFELLLPSRLGHEVP